MPLRDIAGQPVAVKSLAALVAAGRTPHAMLFHGPNGVGKRTTAFALAQAVNCPDSSDGDGCGTCPVCERIAKGIDIDVRFFAPTRNELRRETANEMREEAFISPNTGKRKFLILDNAHHITPQAANLLLKVLEEPPETTVFILLTDSPHLILPTINSRTIKMPFKPLTLQETSAALSGRADSEALPLLYSLANGDAGRILSLATDTGLSELYHDVRNLLDNTLIGAGDVSPMRVAEIINTLAERIESGTEDDTPASRARKSVIAVLETMMSLLETKLKNAAAHTGAKPGKHNLSAQKICTLIETIIDTIKIVNGSGHTVLALENLAIGFRKTVTA